MVTNITGIDEAEVQNQWNIKSLVLISVLFCWLEFAVNIAALLFIFESSV